MDNEVELVRELTRAQETNNFRGLWIPVNKYGELDIVSLIQAYTHYDRRMAIKKLKILIAGNHETVKFTYGPEHARFADIETCSTVLGLILPSTIRYVKEHIASEFCGQMEVPCRWGKVDVLTSRYMFFIEDAERWEGAFGKILTCSSCFPSHTPVLVVNTDEDEDPELLDFIKQICHDYDIRPMRVYKDAGEYHHSFMSGCENCGSDMVSVHVSHSHNSPESSEGSDGDGDSEQETESISDCEVNCECDECRLTPTN
jgi:hypothetical protein